jgi:hypothetical protein
LLRSLLGKVAHHAQQLFRWYRLGFIFLPKSCLFVARLFGEVTALFLGRLGVLATIMRTLFVCSLLMLARFTRPRFLRRARNRPVDEHMPAKPVAEMEIEIDLTLAQPEMTAEYLEIPALNFETETEELVKAAEFNLGELAQSRLYRRSNIHKGWYVGDLEKPYTFEDVVAEALAAIQLQQTLGK